jgi:hypothetical protein
MRENIDLPGTGNAQGWPAAFAGVVAIATGLGICALVYYHPEGLNAPAWVVYAAGKVFVAAGLCLFAAMIGAGRVQNFIGIAITLSLWLMAGWVAFAPGDRSCTASVSWLSLPANDVLCRFGFAVGWLIFGVSIAVVARAFIRSKKLRQQAGLSGPDADKR